MCGIVAFASNNAWTMPADLSIYQSIARSLQIAVESTASGSTANSWDGVSEALKALIDNFSHLMSFSVHYEIATTLSAQILFTDIASQLRQLRDHASVEIHSGRGSNPLEHLHEQLSDYVWQIESEILSNVKKVLQLLPLPVEESRRAQYFVAWAIEQSLQSLDRLEVRGRDSAGISLVLLLQDNSSAEDIIKRSLRDEIGQYQDVDETSASSVTTYRDKNGMLVFRTVYKVANPVGRLGDNGTALRRAIKADTLLWAVAAHVLNVNLVCHTRWASNGIINIPNCHPVDGRVLRDGSYCSSSGFIAMFVLNGDIDNYKSLIATSVTSRGLSIHPAVSTDAKILPVIFALDTKTTEVPIVRFIDVIRRCQGSFAIVLQQLDSPKSLLVGQKGSGQALYIGQMCDGWLVTSEVYGLAALCRHCWPVNVGSGIGVGIELETTVGEMSLRGYNVAGEIPWLPEQEPINIFARDIWRGSFPTYIEKEINEAPNSVRKTLAGKYCREGNTVRFLMEGFGNCDLLVHRLQSHEQPAIRRLIIVGQGTAAIAAMGIAHLIRRSVSSRSIIVDSAKASELFGFVADTTFEDCILIAVSQSGTTTDTNRIVDLARARGAWIHAIVNRRNSALVQKAHSCIYTSDGRDVEMSVASTKAYYSQIVAGKLLGLLIASTLESMVPERIANDIDNLERLPSQIEEVLARQEKIAALATSYAPFSRNWAVVGNGSNRIAAEEIRIKLSELCYKAIPCDVTEDKKHIDISTEPLALVVANDLPEMVVQDTVKEVSILKAHNSRPVVLCSSGETRFDEVATATIQLPLIGGGLDFVLATVAGHLFGIAAARAIDQAAVPFRIVRGILSLIKDQPTQFNRSEFTSALKVALDTVETGAADSSLAASTTAACARYLNWLNQQPAELTAAQAQVDEAICILNRVIEDLTRPIDTIRHQAKTVTVGISRPQQGLSPLIQMCFSVFDLTVFQIHDADLEMLEVLSPLVTNIDGALLYEVIRVAHSSNTQWTLYATRAFGSAQVEQSRFQNQRHAEGSKHSVLRTGSGICTTAADGKSLVIVPILGENSNVISNLLQMHVSISPIASLQQKIAVLRAIGSKYDKLVERIGDILPNTAVESVVTNVKPHDLIFTTVDNIIRIYTTHNTNSGELVNIKSDT